MGELLVPAGVGLLATGAVTQGIAANTQGKSEQNLARFNAQVQEKEAKAIEASSKFESQRAASEAHRRKGSQAVASAKGGTSGSAVAEDLAAGQAAEDELEQLLISFEGQTAAGKARSQGKLDIAQGKIARQRGKSKQKASLIQAGGTLLMGF